MLMDEYFSAMKNVLTDIYMASVRHREPMPSL